MRKCLYSKIDGHTEVDRHTEVEREYFLGFCIKCL
jgi:hypothetical protein